VKKECTSKRLVLSVEKILSTTLDCINGLLLWEIKKISRVTAAEIIDTCSPEELVESVMYELASHVYDGITTHELCRILREKFSVLEQYCCDIVQRLKNEMYMYCPDRQHLYYV
jgi:phage gp36-like protein